jgi:hypothetical protein
VQTCGASLARVRLNRSSTTTICDFESNTKTGKNTELTPGHCFRMTRNPLGFGRRGFNPLGVVLFAVLLGNEGRDTL